MPPSILKDFQGPDWPLGSIVVATPGVPVGIMSLVDPLSVNDPNSATSLSSGEYTVRAHQIQFQGMRPGVGGGLTTNTGNIYVVRAAPPKQGSGNRADSGCIVAVIFPGQTFFFSAAEQNMDVLSPYRYFIDADNTGDASQTTLYLG